MSSRCPDGRGLALALLATGALAACEREDRQFRNWPPAASATTAIRESPLQPGPTTREDTLHPEYESNGWAVSEGQAALQPVQLLGVPLPGRRRHRPAAHGRAVDLRQRAGKHLRDDRGGPAQRHAVVQGPAGQRSDLAARRVRPLDERAARQGCRDRTERRHAGPEPGAVRREGHAGPVGRCLRRRSTRDAAAGGASSPARTRPWRPPARLARDHRRTAVAPDVRDRQHGASCW